MTDWLAYLINSAAWSVVGFISGWLLATVGRDVKDIKEAVVPDRVKQQRAPHPNGMRVLGIVVALLAIVTVVQGYMLSSKQAAVVECQATYNDRFAEATQRRAALADEDREALTNMLLGLYRQRDDSERERLRTFEQWVETTQRNERYREAHPLPELPKGDCR